MPNPFQKSVQNYVSKIKLIPRKQIKFHSSSFSSSKKWILKHIKKSHSTLKGKRNKKIDDDDKQDEAAKLSDVDRFLFENFKSLYFNNDGEGFDKEKKLSPKYDHDHDDDHGHDDSSDDDNDGDGDGDGDGESDDDNGRYDENQSQTPTSETVTTLFESPKFTDIPLDLCESKLYVRSRSISHSVTRRRSVSNVSMMTTTTISNGMTSESCARIEFGSNSNSYQNGKDVVEVPDDCIVVLRCSPSPQSDFQRSMQEMVDLRLQENKEVDWEFMKELLFCFLNLNEPKSFQFILSAFVDLVVEVREIEGKSLTNPQSFLLGSKNKIVET